MKNFFNNVYSDIFSIRSPSEMSMSEIIDSAKRQGIVLMVCVVVGALPLVLVWLSR